MLGRGSCGHRLETTFKQLAAAADCKDWRHLFTDDGRTARVRAKSDTTSIIEFSYDINVPLDQVIRLCRPEVLFRLEQHPWMHLFCDWSLLETVAPGDVVCSYQPVPMLALICDLFSRAQSSTQGCAENRFLGRAVLQRDYPEFGEVSLGMAGFGTQANFLSNIGMTISRTSDESVTHVRETYETPHVPDWMIMRLFRHFGHYLYQNALWEIAASVYSPILEEQCGVVVGLKKCCRGLPLVPWRNQEEKGLEEEEFRWLLPDDPESFTLTTYLQHILKVRGLDASVIFDSLDGRRVVYWQAVVRKAVWSQLWCTLEPIFKQLSTAYRKHYGCTGAPFIRAGVSPRFRSEPVEFARLRYGAAGCSSEESPLPVKNTFVHFAEDECALDEARSQCLRPCD